MSRQVLITRGRRFGKSMFYLFKYAQAHGWSAAMTNGGHLRFTKPGRPIIHTSSTPSDWRAVDNAVAMLARADRHSGFVAVEVAHV